MNRKERRAAAKQERGGRAQFPAGDRSAKIERVIALVGEGNLAEAESLLETVRRGDPSDPEAKHQLGMIYVRTGRAEPGLDLLRQAVAARPEESLYWNNLAAACLAIERSQEAVDAARKAVALDARNFMAWQNLALGLRDLRDNAGAVAAFEKAADLGTMPASGLGSWGECLGALKRFPEAEKIVHAALDAVPDDTALLTLLGWLLSEQRKDAEAREVLRRSLDKKPDQFLAAFNYGVLSLRADAPDVALRWLRRATSIEPKSAPAWKILASELARQGLAVEALPAAERALRLAPSDKALSELVRKLKGGTSGEVATISIDFDAFGAPAPIGPGGDLGGGPGGDPRGDPGGDPGGEKSPTDNGDAPVFDLQILKIGDQA